METTLSNTIYKELPDALRRAAGRGCPGARHLYRGAGRRGKGGGKGGEADDDDDDDDEMVEE